MKHLVFIILAVCALLVALPALAGVDGINLNDEEVTAYASCDVQMAPSCTCTVGTHAYLELEATSPSRTPDDCSAIRALGLNTYGYHMNGSMPAPTHMLWGSWTTTAILEVHDGVERRYDPGIWELAPVPSTGTTFRDNNWYINHRQNGPQLGER